VRGTYRDGPSGQNAEGAVAPNCQGGRSTNFSVGRFDTCFGGALGAVGEEAAERFGEAPGGNVGEAGSSVGSPAAGPGRPAGRGQMKSSARPVGAVIGAPLTSTRVAIGSAGLGGPPPNSSSGVESAAFSGTTGPANGRAGTIGGAPGV